MEEICDKCGDEVDSSDSMPDPEAGTGSLSPSATRRLQAGSISKKGPSGFGSSSFHGAVPQDFAGTASCSQAQRGWRETVMPQLPPSWSTSRRRIWMSKSSGAAGSEKMFGRNAGITSRSSTPGSKWRSQTAAPSFTWIPRSSYSRAPNPASAFQPKTTIVMTRAVTP